MYCLALLFLPHCTASHACILLLISALVLALHEPLSLRILVTLTAPYPDDYNDRSWKALHANSSESYSQRTYHCRKREFVPSPGNHHRPCCVPACKSPTLTSSINRHDERPVSRHKKLTEAAGAAAEALPILSLVPTTSRRIRTISRFRPPKRALNL